MDAIKAPDEVLIAIEAREAARPKENGGRRLFNGIPPKDVLEKLRYAWKLGCTDSEAASHAKINKTTLSELLRDFPELEKQKETLKETPFVFARTALYKAMEKGDGKLALQFLERKLPNEFSTKQELTFNNPPTINFIPAKKAEG